MHVHSEIGFEGWNWEWWRGGLDPIKNKYFMTSGLFCVYITLVFHGSTCLIWLPGLHHL